MNTHVFRVNTHISPRSPDPSPALTPRPLEAPATGWSTPRRVGAAAGAAGGGRSGSCSGRGHDVLCVFMLFVREYVFLFVQLYRRQSSRQLSACHPVTCQLELPNMFVCHLASGPKVALACRTQDPQSYRSQASRAELATSYAARKQILRRLAQEATGLGDVRRPS